METKAKENALDQSGISKMSDPQPFQIKFNPKFIKTSLRNINYDIESALSEFVDNSIDADATNVDIVIPNKKELQQGTVPIQINDNGNGMSYEELIRSFNFGSDRPYSDIEIGYYGVGMKSAMAYLSEYAVIETKRLDDDLISVVEWDIENDTLNPKIYKKENTARIKSGTRITLFTNHNRDKYSRFEFFTHSQPSYVIKRFSCRYYMAMTNLGVNINVVDNRGSSKVEPFDPMYRNNDKVKRESCEVPIKIDDNQYVIKLDGYSLVYVDNGQEKTERSILGFNMDYQGVYMLYCNKYINLGGTWLGSRLRQQSSNWTRIELDIPKQITEYFGISMNKNSSIDLRLDDFDDTIERHSRLKMVVDKINYLANWGLKLYKDKIESEKTTNPDDLEELKKFNNDLNNSLKKKGFKKINEGIEKLTEITKKDQPEKNDNPLTKERPDNLVYNKELVKIDYFNGPPNATFWRIEKEGKKLVIWINKNHAFFTKYLSKTVEIANIDEKNRIGVLHMFEFLAALAMSELRTYETEDDKIISFWDRFWYDVSYNIDKLKD